tara:strand:+ start:180 stop:359 length:180 start_codon:yes stop_codon:yes gene_type:complete
MVLRNEVKGIVGCKKLFEKFTNIYYSCGSKLINSDGKEIRKGTKNICDDCIVKMESEYK